MKFESIAADLRSWLQESIERGCSRDSVVQSMRAAGYQPKFSRETVDLAFARFAPEANDDPGSTAVATATETTVQPAVKPVAAEAETAVAATTAVAPTTESAENEVPSSSSEILAASPNIIDTSDRGVRILFALNAPRVVLFGGLLSAEEC